MLFHRRPEAFDRGLYAQKAEQLAARVTHVRNLHYNVSDPTSDYGKAMLKEARYLQDTEALLQNVSDLMNSALPTRNRRKERELAAAWERIVGEIEHILQEIDHQLLVAGEVILQQGKLLEQAVCLYLTV
ncbi:MAG: hypothetical protein E7620_05360 [Ruminococcaceae bacterium]|nr:hypothetical protein [Oscillospiraceae bacterium]